MLFGYPGIGKSFMMNLFALLLTAIEVPFATYREDEQLYSVFDPSGSVDAYQLPQCEFAQFAVCMQEHGQKKMLLVDPSQTKSYYDLNTIDGVVMASSTNPQRVSTGKDNDSRSYYIMRLPSMHQLEYVTKEEISSLVNTLSVSPRVISFVSDQLAALMQVLPPFLVVGPSIRRSVEVANETVKSLYISDLSSESSATEVRKLLCRAYHSALVAEMKELAKKTVELSFKGTHGLFEFIGPDIDADNKAMQKKLDSPSSVILTSAKTEGPSSRLFAEFPPENVTSSTRYPEYSLLPASALALLLLLSMRSQCKGNQVQRLSSIIQGAAPAVVGFLFEHIVSSSVTNTTISRDSRLAVSLALPVASKALQRSASLWVFKKLAFANGSSGSLVLSKTPRGVLKPKDVTAAKVVYGTTSEPLTHQAIVSAVREYRNVRPMRWMYLSFGFSATPVVDGCLLGPDKLVPVQVTVAKRKELDKAETWVSGLRTVLLGETFKNTVKVTNFCILRPSCDDPLFRLHKDMDITAPSAIPDCPYVVVDYDIAGVTKDADACVQALVEAFTDTIESMMRGHSPTPLPVTSSYPTPSATSQ
jgi:hypothetical protein